MESLRYLLVNEKKIWRLFLWRSNYILITNLMHWLLFIKYYIPVHVLSLKCSSSGGYSCTHAAYGTATLYESSWWPVCTQLEWELIVGGRLLVGVLRHPPTTFPLQSVLTQAVYRQTTSNSRREWQYHMLQVFFFVIYY